MKKIGDYVIEILTKWYSKGGEFYTGENDEWNISVGDNGIFIDLYKALESDSRKPKVFFENWKSNVIQQLKKDNRFECLYATKGRRRLQHIITLKEEYKK
jgi:hypothetical protein